MVRLYRVVASGGLDDPGGQTRVVHFVPLDCHGPEGSLAMTDVGTDVGLGGTVE